MDGDNLWIFVIWNECICSSTSDRLIDKTFHTKLSTFHFNNMMKLKYKIYSIIRLFCLISPCILSYIAKNCTNSEYLSCILWNWENKWKVSKFGVKLWNQSWLNHIIRVEIVSISNAFNSNVDQTHYDDRIQTNAEFVIY